MTSSPSTPSTHSHGSWLGALLDLDAQIHDGVLEEATAEAASLVDDAGAVRRVLDIGAGTGTGSVALATRFPSAEVVAVDVDERMLSRVRERARSRGLEDRITTVTADVAAVAPPLGSAEVIWSSAALHEVDDSGRAFRNLFDALLPGGLLVVLEMDAPPRVLPASDAAFEERVRAAGGTTAVDHPDWTDAIAEAGFTLIRTRRLVADQTLPADGPAGEYAALELRRLGHSGMSALDESDRATLLTLAGDGPGNVRSLGELWVRGTRTLWAARRP
jgi:ubiquinone/menaquinone biosynthesis C-methylase UbiE